MTSLQASRCMMGASCLLLLAAVWEHYSSSSSELQRMQLEKFFAQEDIARCAQQAKQTVVQQLSGNKNLGSNPILTSSSNHFNKKLARCFVNIHTAEAGSLNELLLSELLFDAYENSQILFCISGSNDRLKRTCFDSNTKPIAPDKAEQLVNEYMTN